MPRIRTIKPKYWGSPGLPQDPWARLLYIAMWNWADDWGRGSASERELLGFAFPNDDHIESADIRRMFGELHRIHGVVFYRVAGRPYFFIPSWEEHQKVDKRTDSRLPAPEDGVPYNPETGEPLQGSDLHVHHLHPTSTESPPEVPRKVGGESVLEVGSLEVGSLEVGASTKASAPATPRATPTTPDETPNQRANRLAKCHHERQPMSKFVATAGVVKAAIKAGKTDDEITEALIRLADEGRSVTVDSLRLEIEGFPAPRQQPAKPATSDLRRADVRATAARVKAQLSAQADPPNRPMLGGAA